MKETQWKSRLSASDSLSILVWHFVSVLLQLLLVIVRFYRRQLPSPTYMTEDEEGKTFITRLFIYIWFVFVSCARLSHGDFQHLLIASDCRHKCDRHYTRLYKEAVGLEAKDPNSKWFCISAVLILLFLSLLHFIQCVHLPLLLLYRKIQRSVLHARHPAGMLFRHEDGPAVAAGRVRL